MIRAVMPVNDQASSEASDEFYRNHPELIEDGNRQTISSDNENYFQLRAEWLNLYSKNGGRIDERNIHIPSKPVKHPIQKCPHNKCKIDNLIVQCSHNRKAGPSGILCIVADTQTSETIKCTVQPFDINVSNKIDYEGEDKITSELQCKGQDCDCEIRLAGQTSPDKEWKQGSKRVDSLQATPYLQKKSNQSLGRVAPENITVTARTTAGTKTVLVKQYPSDQYSCQVEVETLKKLGEEINDKWRDWGENFFKWAPLTLVPELTAPSGSLTCSYGWKEEKHNWDAFFEIGVEAALDPLIGLQIKISVSAAECLYAAAGFPELAPLLAKHLADIGVGCGVGVTGKLVGGAAFQKYTSGQKKSSGKLSASIEGSFSINLFAHVGSDYITSASVTGTATTTIANEWPVECDEEGITFQPSIKLKPMTVSVVVKTKAFNVDKGESDKDWKLWQNDVDVWAPDKTYLMKFS